MIALTALITCAVAAAEPAPPAPLPTANGTLTLDEEAPLRVMLASQAELAHNERMVSGWGMVGVGLGVVGYELTSLGIAASTKNALAQQTVGTDYTLGTAIGLLVTVNGALGVMLPSPAEKRLDDFEKAPHDDDAQRWQRSSELLHKVKASDALAQQDLWIAPALGSLATLCLLGVGVAYVALDVTATGAQRDPTVSAANENLAYVSFAAAGGVAASSIATYFWSESPDHALLDAIEPTSALAAAAK